MAQAGRSGEEPSWLRHARKGYNRDRQKRRQRKIVREGDEGGVAVLTSLSTRGRRQVVWQSSSSTSIAVQELPNDGEGVGAGHGAAETTRARSRIKTLTRGRGERAGKCRKKREKERERRKDIKYFRIYYEY